MIFLVMRKEGLDIDRMVLVETKTSLSSSEEFLDELKDGVTAWARKTENGRQCWEYAGTDMNIGDVSEYFNEIVAYCPNIEEISVQDLEVSGDWSYDTVLCDDIEEDDFD